MKTFIKYLSLVCMTLVMQATHAEVTFQGFASFVGGALVNEDDTSYLGYENRIEFDKNSLYALQASSDMGEGLTVTGQLIARGTENYKPEFEWLYVSKNLTPTLNAKMGRIRTPFYMFSEYLEVGYTYHWIRPPIELYASQVTNMDGVSFLYNLPLGGIDSQWMLSLGNRESFSDDPGVNVSDYKPLIAFNGQFEMGAYTAKLIYTQGNLTVETDDITAATAGFSDAAFVSKHIAIDDAKITFAGAALDINLHPIKILLEYSTIDFEDLVFLPDETRMLASLAYSLSDNFLVHYSFSTNVKESDSALAAEATGDSNIPTVTNQALAAQILASTDRDVTTHTIGMRYDFHNSAAFKMEVIATEDADIDTEATLLRFGVDMLF